MLTIHARMMPSSTSWAVYIARAMLGCSSIMDCISVRDTVATSEGATAWMP